MGALGHESHGQGEVGAGEESCDRALSGDTCGSGVREELISRLLSSPSTAVESERPRIHAKGRQNRGEGKTVET
jgi:hypothetical protein